MSDLKRKEANTSLLKEAFQGSAILAIAIVLLMIFVSAIRGEDVFGPQLVYIPLGTALAILPVVFLTGLVNRTITLHKDVIAIQSMKSKFPKTIEYRKIERCEIRTINTSEKPMVVMDIFDKRRLLETLEIPHDEDPAPLVKFLEDWRVKVEIHSLPQTFV
ncbi:MAG: hypothetical protein AB8G18_14220 [Gammaproteobacteria bacterium]